MGTESTASPDPDTADRADRVVVATGIAAALAVVLAGAVLLIQIEVTDADVAVTRSFGSVFDTLVDRSGWEQWWVHDLDEPDEVRSALLRTTRCPEAVNRRIAIAALLGATAVVMGAVAMARRRSAGSAEMAAAPVGRRLVRIGRLTAAVGGALTVLGITAIVVLVADADSTLFLYTDRLVVAVVGLIVLVPAIALFVIGRVLVLLGERAEPIEADRTDG